MFSRCRRVIQPALRAQAARFSKEPRSLENTTYSEFLGQTMKSALFASIVVGGYTLGYLYFFGDGDLENSITVQSTVTDIVYLDIAVGKNPPKRVEIGLYGTAAPMAVQNFIALCEGVKTGDSTLHYKNTKAIKAAPSFLVLFGDVTNNDGTGGKSIYGNTFEDENLKLVHKGFGVVSMANTGSNSNNSKFFISTRNIGFLDGKNQIVGQVLCEGALIRDIVKDASIEDGSLKEEVRIADCGVLPKSRLNDYTFAPIEDYGTQLPFGASLKPVISGLERVLSLGGEDEKETPAPSKANNKASKYMENYEEFKNKNDEEKKN